MSRWIYFHLIIDLMSETIGQKLFQARKGRDLSLEQAANETHIRLHYLEALENGDLDQIPSRAQARGFLRAYASYLGISSDSLFTELDEVEPIPIEAEPRQGFRR